MRVAMAFITGGNGQIGPHTPGCGRPARLGHRIDCLNVSTPKQAAPVTLKIGALVALLQSLVAFGVAIYLIVADFTSEATPTLESEAAAANWIGTGTAIFIFILFGTVLAGAISLLRGRHWGRSPIVMMGVLLLPVSWYMVSEGLIGAGIATALSAIAALVGLLHPRSTEWIAENYGR